MDLTQDISFETIRADARTLLQLLERERNILLGPHSTNTSDIAVEKNKLIDTIEQRMSVLRQTGSNSALSEEQLIELSDVLSQCKTINAENSALVNQRLATIRQSIAVIRTATHSTDVELYNRQGKHAQSAVSRALADA